MSLSHPVQVRLVDDLTKIIPTQNPPTISVTPSIWRGQTASFQVAFKTELNQEWKRLQPRLSVSCPGTQIRLSQVNLVAVALPGPPNSDTGYMLKEPGMMPDLLVPLSTEVNTDGAVESKVSETHVGWHSIWVDLHLPRTTASAQFKKQICASIKLVIADQQVFQQDLKIDVVPRDLPRPQIVHTQWFHADCLANYYQVGVWSDNHWQAIESQVASCARMGINCLMAPAWTPPTDTAVGHYRTPTQLLGISRTAAGYHFETTLLDRWLDLAEKYGIDQVELPHLFTQWGAYNCPQFLISEGEQTVPQGCFGWEVSATDTQYLDFLGQLIPFLRRHLEQRFGVDRVWWHVSDEPHSQHLESYRQAQAGVRNLLEGARVIDALSSPEIGKLVRQPVVATDAVQGFRDTGCEPEWVYYCVSQNRGLANRFVAQRPIRHRLLGWQLYKNQAKGFLHWAANFYNTQYSLRPIDPFADNSAGGGFFSGDSFVLYPGPDFQSWESLRHRMVGAAFSDLAILQSAEEVLGRAEVLRIIDPQDDLDYASGWVEEAVFLQRLRHLNEVLIQVLPQS